MLWDAVHKGEAECVLAHAEVINKAEKAGDWRASAWLLERRFPKEYGPRRLCSNCGKSLNPYAQDDEQHPKRPTVTVHLPAKDADPN